MAWRVTARLLRLRVAKDVRRAFDYLEKHGQRFLIDFGTANAVAVARQHWRDRKRKQRGLV